MAPRHPRVKVATNWLPQVLTAASTVAATWGLMVHFIGPAVQAAVKYEVQAEFKKQRIITEYVTDSVNAILLDSMRIEIACATQEVTSQLGLIATKDGNTVTYSPRIVVQADTTGLAEVNAKVDLLTDAFNKMMAFLRLQYTMPDPATKGDGHKKKPIPR